MTSSTDSAQNTRYVVTEGARQQYEPEALEEAGALRGALLRLGRHRGSSTRTEIGPADGSERPVEQDAFAAVEKGISQKAQALSAAQRLDALGDLNDDRWSDPYTHSKRLRKSFRQEKRVRVAVEAKDDAIRDRYGLGRDIKLIEEKPEEARAAAQAFQSGRRAREADEARKRRRIEASTTTLGKPVKSLPSPSVADTLKSRLLIQSRQSSDPFGLASSSLAQPSHLPSIRR
jgi:coiled-coil domain-containing protein 130